MNFFESGLVVFSLTLPGGLVLFIYSNQLFKPLPQSFYIAQKLWRPAPCRLLAPCRTLALPSAADTTAGRIYFSTPSAQVRVPVGDLVFPPPHFCSHYTTNGKIIRRRKNYPAAA